MENLRDFGIFDDPYLTFSHWYQEALKVEENADAFSLASADKNGRPNNRVLLFKGLKENSFSFYSHYHGQKGRELEKNPYAALAFYWHQSKRQVRVLGEVKKMSREDSIAYFSSRARESQIASAVSDQSQVIASRADLMAKYKELDDQHADEDIPCPKSWGGYLVKPYEFEFFIYGDYRINDRFVFKSNQNSWSIERLQP